MLITDFAQVLRAEQMWFWWDTAVGDADGNWQFHHINKRLARKTTRLRLRKGTTTPSLRARRCGNRSIRCSNVQGYCRLGSWAMWHAQNLDSIGCCWTRNWAFIHMYVAAVKALSPPRLEITVNWHPRANCS